MFGVAGTVAEHVLSKEEFFCWEDLLSCSEAMSSSDWRTAECIPGEPSRKLLRAAERCARLLFRGGDLYEHLINEAIFLLRRYPPCLAGAP